MSSEAAWPRRAPLVWGWVFLALTLAMAHGPVLGSALRRVQGDEGDVRFNHYVLEHGFRWLTGAPMHRSFWDPPMFFPVGNIAAYSDILLGVAPFYWAWRAAGIPSDASYALWVLTLTALNFLGMYLLLRRAFAASALAASFGATLFAAGASRCNQLNHPQLLSQAWALLAIGALIGLYRKAGRPAARIWMALAALGVVAQIYAGLYGGWFLGFLLLLAACAALTRGAWRRPMFAPWRAHAATLVICALGAAFALWPLISHSLAAAREVGLRDVAEIRGMLPRLQSWFYLGPDSWLYGWTASWSAFARLPMEGEHRIGLGLFTTAVTIAMAWRHRDRPAVRTMAVVAVAAVLLATMYRYRLSPWYLVFHLVPGAGAIRAVARIGIWLLIPASVGLSLLVDRVRIRETRWIPLTIAVLCLAEQGIRTPVFDGAAAAADVARLAREVRGCRSFFYSPVPAGSPDFKYQADAIWAGLEAGVPTVNGFSGNTPPGWDLDDVAVRSEADAARIADRLDRWIGSRGLRKDEVCLVRYAAAR